MLATPDLRFVAVQAIPLRSGPDFMTFTFRSDFPGAPATIKAQYWLECHGFSVGYRSFRGKRGVIGKRGVLFGRFYIPAWRDLSDVDRVQLDGVVDDGHLTSVVRIWPDASAEAIAAALGREFA